MLEISGRFMFQEETAACSATFQRSFVSQIKIVIGK